MSVTIVLVLFAQVVFTWLLAPLLAGMSSAISLGDTRKILQPYRDLLVSLRGSDQISLIAWAFLMMLVLLIPVISLRAPFDWMGDSIFMWSSLFVAQLLLVNQSQRLVVLLGNTSFLFLLLGAAFASESFQSTVMLSNGVHLSVLALVTAIILLLLTVILWGRVLVTGDSQFKLNDWCLWTTFWTLVLWTSAVLFPASLAFSLSAGALLVAAGFLVVKFLVGVVVLSIVTLLSQRVPSRMAIALQIILVLLSAGFFSYFVLA